jgi:hypothetical protein
MLVGVVGIGHVRMHVPSRLVPMKVAVRPRGHRVVHVVVVSVVVRVGVLVLELHMLVFVAVRLEQMQNNARQHQRATNDHPGAQPAVTARTAVIVAPSSDLMRRTWPGSRSATARDSVLSTPQAAAAPSTASNPSPWTPPLNPRSSTSAMPPARSRSNRRPYAAIHHLSIERAGEQRGEERLERQHQRGAGTTRVLQTPRERHRTDPCAEQAHQSQPTEVTAKDGRFSLDRLAQQCAEFGKGGAGLRCGACYRP